MKSNLVISYIPNAYTEEEGDLTKLESFEYKLNEGFSCATVPHTKVKLPNDEIIEVVSEITDYGNTFSARVNGVRICSIKTTGAFNLAFVTPSGVELYAELCI